MRISTNQSLVLGPPGSGKTTYILNQIDELMQNGVSPDKIAFVSFTRKAIEEAIDRAASKFHLKKKQLPLFKTIHALCFAGLGISKKDVMSKDHYRELGDLLGYQFEGTWDESEGTPVGSEKGDILLFLDNLARITQKPLREIWEDNYTVCSWEELEQFQDSYQEYKSTHFVMDFTDMLYAYVSMCDASHAEHLFVDEAQDLSAAQWMVLKHAFGNVKKTIIVGDDDQSIYKWSGADVSTFLQLAGDQTVLSKSYRLPQEIHAFSHNIISKVDSRFSKEFTPRDKGGQVEFFRFLEHVDLKNDETTMFLVRNVYIMRRVQDHLERLGVPYIGKNGFSAIRKTHIRAIRTVEKLQNRQPISGAEAKDLYDSMRVGHYLKHGAKTKIQLLADTEQVDFAMLNTQYGLLDIGPWPVMLQGINENTVAYYQAVLSNGYKFDEDPKCSVSTIHAAKGGEADHVIILSDMAEKSFREYEKNPDDERRVAYVGVTRAKHRLSIIEPSSKRYFPYYMEGQLS